MITACKKNAWMVNVVAFVCMNTAINAYAERVIESSTVTAGVASSFIDMNGNPIIDSVDMLKIGSSGTCSTEHFLGTGDTIFCGAVEFSSAIYFIDPGVKPSCDSTHKGLLFYDTTTAEMCLSDGAGGYAWVGFGSIGGGAGDALVADPLSQFAATTSAQLAGVLTDETGTGTFVLSSVVANAANWDTAYTQRIQSVTAPVTFSSGVLAVGYDDQSVVLNGSNQLTTAQDIRTSASPTFANTTLSANGIVNGTLSVGLGAASSKGLRVAVSDNQAQAGVWLSQGSTGDVGINMSLNSDNKAFMVGVRNSNDTFRISSTTTGTNATLDPLTSNVLLTMTTAGATTFTGSVTVPQLITTTVGSDALTLSGKTISATGGITLTPTAGSSVSIDGLTIDGGVIDGTGITGIDATTIATFENAMEANIDTLGAITFTAAPTLQDPGTKPTCDSSVVGSVFRDAGSVDTVEICVQTSSAPTYAWTNLISQGTAYTFGDGVNLVGSDVRVDFNPSNLQITAAQINTIQDIATTSNVLFNSAAVNYITMGDPPSRDRPTCDSSIRGRIWTELSNSTPNDRTAQCLRNIDGSFAWIQMARSGGTVAPLDGGPTEPTAGMVATYTGATDETQVLTTSTVTITGDDVVLASGGKVDGIDISARFDDKSYKSDASITFHHVAVGGDDSYGSLRGTTVDGDELAILVWDVDGSAHVKWARAINGNTPTVDLNAIVTHNNEAIAHNTNGIDSLSSVEVDQLENINTSEISETEWGYVASMDQGVGTTDNVTFGQVIVDNVRVNGSTIIAQTGNVAISGQNSTDKVRVQSELELNYMPQLITPLTSKPDCDADSRGKIWRVTGGSGAGDSTEFCDKKSDGSYAWQAHLKLTDVGTAATSNFIGDTKYVVAPSGAPYTSIQSAIDACVAAETETYDAPCLIKILPGNYAENVTLAASVVLEGANDGVLPSISGVVTANFGNNTSGPYNVSASLKNLRINSQTGAYAIDFTGTTAQSLWLTNVRIYKGTGTGKGIRINNSGASTVGSYTSIVYVDDVYVQGAGSNATACVEHSAGRVNVRGDLRLENPTLAATWVSTGSAVSWQTSGNIYAEGKFTFASSGQNILTSVAMTVGSSDRCVNNTGAGTLILGQFGCSAVSPNSGAMIDAAGAIVYSRGTSAGINFASVVTGAGAVAATDVFGTVFQPLDSDLTSIAAVNTTSFGRGFLALADQAAAQTYIGASGGGGTSYTFDDGLIETSGSVAVDYNTTNLKITSTKLNTIQDIATTATPTFGGLTVSHSDTSTTPKLSITQASTGDAAMLFGLGSTRSYAVGIDNSASDSFVVSTAASGSAVLGTNNLMTLDSSGNMTIAGALTSTGSTTFDQIVVDSLTLNNTSLTSSGNLTLATGSGGTVDFPLAGTGTVTFGSVMRLAESGNAITFGASSAPEAKFWFITDGSSANDLQGANGIFLYPNVAYNSSANKAGYGMRGRYDTDLNYSTFGGLGIGKLNTVNADSKGIVKLLVGNGSDVTGDSESLTAALTCQGTGSTATCSQVGTNFTANVTLDAGITLDGYDVGAVLGSLGSTYQPLDSDLTAIAALTTTSYGRGLLQSANASALRTSAALSSSDAVTFSTVTTSKITMSDSGTRGTCDSAAVGEIFLETSGSTDTFDICVETAASTYAWTDLIAAGGGGGGGSYTAGDGLVLSGGEFSFDPSYSPVFAGVQIADGGYVRPSSTASLAGFNIQGYDTDASQFISLIEILNADDIAFNISNLARIDSNPIAQRDANNNFLDITTTSVVADYITIDDNSITQTNADMVFSAPSNMGYFFYITGQAALNVYGDYAGAHLVSSKIVNTTTGGDAAMAFANTADEVGFSMGLNSSTGNFEISAGTSSVNVGSDPVFEIDSGTFATRLYGLLNVPTVSVNFSNATGDLKIKQSVDSTSAGLVLGDVDNSTKYRFYVDSSNLLNVYDGTDTLLSVNAATDVVKTTKKFVQNHASVTLASGATTFALTGNVQTVNCDAGTNTIATITGGFTGMEVTLLFADALCTIAEDESTSSDTVDLSATSNFSPTAGTILKLVHIGGYWHEVSRSIN